MYRVGTSARAIVLAVAIGVGVGSAYAGPEASGDNDARVLFFAGTDLWRHGGFAHGGLLWSPHGLDREGFVIKAMAGGGIYHYVSGALGNVDVQGRQLSAAILPGWRFKRERLIVTAFAGLDLQNHRLTPDDTSAGLRGSYAGLRGTIDLWYEPSATTMVTAYVSGSTIGPSYSGRLAFGWRVNDRFYLGPAIEGFEADGNYHQFRLGAHVTGFKTADFEWSAGLGFADDSDHRSGLYGKLGVLTRR